MEKKRAFTLIELMVVIAIMGLFATIVLVSLRGARERAKIAASMQFSNSIRASLSDALVSWWNFNEGLGDAVGDTWEGNTGTKIGASWTKGVAGDALSFDGVNDYVQVPNNPTLNFGATESFTIEAWIKTSRGRADTVVAKWYGGGYILTIPLSERIHFGIRGGGGDSSIESTTRITLGVWYHIVGVRDVANDLILLYVNGVKEASATDNSTSSIGTIYPFYIGILHGQYEPFWGTIDEVRIYNRSLTAFEIQKKYAEGLNKFKLVEK